MAVVNTAGNEHIEAETHSQEEQIILLEVSVFGQRSKLCLSVQSSILQGDRFDWKCVGVEKN